MRVDWDNIKYIFQVPVDWFKTMSNRVLYMYGTNFLQVKVDEDEALYIDIDEAMFNQQVLNAIETELENLVTTNTNQTITGTKTFVNGFLVGDGISSPGAMYMDNGDLVVAAGGSQNEVVIAAAANNATLTNHPTDTSITSLAVATVGYCQETFGKVKTVNGSSPDENGNVVVTAGAGTVRSVDHHSPDQEGNVQLNAICTINGHNGDSVGNFDGVVTTVNGSAPVDGAVTIDCITQTELRNALANYVLATQLDTTLQGYVTANALAMELQDYVTTTTFSDALADCVSESTLSAALANYVTTSSLSGYVTVSALATTLEDYATQEDIEDFATTEELELLESMIALEYVRSVDGHIPGASGAVSFNLSNNKWVKTNATGNLTTTNEEPVVVTSATSGYIYNNNGTVEYKDDEYVTLDTQQTITATKYFQNAFLNVFGGTITVKDSSAQGVGTTIDHANIYLHGGAGTTFINMAYGNTSNDAWITKTVNGFTIFDPTAVRLNAPANMAVLMSQPTETSTNSLAIATVGYCQTHFGGSGGGTVRSVDNVSPDQQGNVQLNAIRTINGHNGDSVGNFDGVVTSVNGTFPDANGEVTLSGLVHTINSSAPDANGDISGIVTSVDGHTPVSSGAVTFGLAANAWVKTDASGHLSTTTDKVVAVSANDSPVTINSLPVVTSVFWNGTKLQYTYKNLKFKNGVLISNPTALTSEIDTPVKVAWS